MTLGVSNKKMNRDFLPVLMRRDSVSLKSTYYRGNLRRGRLPTKDLNQDLTWSI